MIIDQSTTACFVLSWKCMPSGLPFVGTSAASPSGNSHDHMDEPERDNTFRQTWQGFSLPNLFEEPSRVGCSARGTRRKWGEGDVSAEVEGMA